MSRNPTQKADNSVPNKLQASPKKRKLRIGEAEIRGMGELLAQRLTETEACGVLGIAPRSWFRWKSRQRNGGRFAALLEAITGQKIAAHIRNIEAGAVGAGPHKRADWRASLSMVERVLAPQRYGTQQTQLPPLPPPTPANVVNVWVALAYSKGAAQAADSPAGPLIDTGEAKLLPETTAPAALEPIAVQPSTGMQVWLDRASEALASPEPGPGKRQIPPAATPTPSSTKGV
jgi:hypothetical protein